jgi:hypothetical protein
VSCGQRGIIRPACLSDLAIQSSTLALLVLVSRSIDTEDPATIAGWSGSSWPAARRQVRQTTSMREGSKTQFPLGLVLPGRRRQRRRERRPAQLTRPDRMRGPAERQLWHF